MNNANSEINYTVDYRDVKNPRLEFRTGQLHLVLPMHYKNEKKILDNYRDWIKSKQEEISRALHGAKNKDLKNRNLDELKHLINKHYQKVDLANNINNFYFRNMSSKWASLSSKNNITFNKKMKYLPEKLIKYILVHELAHTKERRHNENFWNIIENRIKDYKKKEKELFEYWFLINQKEP